MPHALDPKVAGSKMIHSHLAVFYLKQSPGLKCHLLKYIQEAKEVVAMHLKFQSVVLSSWEACKDWKLKHQRESNGDKRGSLNVM